MDFDWTLETAGPVTLVRARLRNERATDREVRLQNCLDGPVLPPRRHGTPEAGWGRDSVTTVVPAGETVALGYACPAPETEPPVVVDEVGPVEESKTRESSLDAAVRELDDHRPPRDVLGCDTRTQRSGTAGEGTASIEAPPDIDQGSDPDDAVDSIPAQSATSLPGDINESLSRYRTRIETIEALGATGVPEATALLAASDGLTGVETLADELDSDARELRALAATAATLAARAEAATPPTDALRRLS